MIPTGIPTGAGGVSRLVGSLVRRAEAGLVYGAARNAAAGIADGRAKRLEELRTLRDLRALEAGVPAAHTLDVRDRRASAAR